MDRRRFLSIGGGVAAAGFLSGGVPFRPVQGARAEGRRHPGAHGLEAELARFALGIRHDALPAEVTASAKRVVLDALGCALAAFGSDAASMAHQTIDEAHGQRSASTIIGHSMGATLEGAIFVNGVLVRALDLNDTYVGTDTLHPSELLPIALAACEAGRMTGRHFIEAVVAGYEVATRVNDAMPFMEHGIHPLCALSYAAPVILGKAWNLPAASVGHAVGISAARGYDLFALDGGAIGMMTSVGFAATAAEAVLITRLAARGFKGPSGTLECVARRQDGRLPPLAVDLRPENYRLPKVALRRFPVRIELQAVAEAGVRLSRRIGAKATDIREIRVQADPGMLRRSAVRATFPLETQGPAERSLPVSLAMALLDGNVNVAQFDAGRWRAPDVMRLVGRTVVTPGTAPMGGHPQGRGCSVEILFNDGTMDRETVEVAEGDAERPLSWGSLVDRFMSFASTVVGEAQAQQIAASVAQLEKLKSLDELTAMLRPRQS